MTSASLATYIFSNAELHCIAEAIRKAIAVEHSHDFTLLYRARLVTIDNILAARNIRG